MSSLMKSGGSLPDPNQKATNGGNIQNRRQQRNLNTSRKSSPGAICGLYKVINANVNKISKSQNDHSKLPKERQPTRSLTIHPSFLKEYDMSEMSLTA